MITYDARILAEHMLENGRKWVLHPNFFSGNISKVILRISLKKMKPSRMDPGGGVLAKPPLDPGLVYQSCDVVDDKKKTLKCLYLPEL